MSSIKDDILSKFEWRHACKEFDSNKKVSVDDFEFLMNVIRMSPSSFGLQPYEVFVLQNVDILKQLHPHMWGAQKQLFTASHVLMFVTRKDIQASDEYTKYILKDIQKWADDDVVARQNLIGTHYVKEMQVIEDRRYLTDWAAKQAYIALGNVMNAAALIDVDSCPVEGFISEEVSRILSENNVLDVNKYSITAFCCLGYRLKDPARTKTRKPLAELVHYIK